MLGRSGKHLLAMEISPFAQCRHPQALPASPFEPVRYLILRTGGEHEATEISLCARRRGSMAARRARTAGRQGLARRHARHDLNHAQRCERWRVSGRHAATRLCRRTEPCHRLPLARRPPRAAAGTRRRIDPAQVRRSCDTGHPAGACRKAGRWRHSDRDGVDWRAGRGWPCGESAAARRQYHRAFRLYHRTHPEASGAAQGASPGNCSRCAARQYEQRKRAGSVGRDQACGPEIWHRSAVVRCQETRGHSAGFRGSGR